MSTRFSLRELPGRPARIEKRGDPAALAREADALRRVAGAPWAPALVLHEPGRLVTTRLPGAPREPAAIGAADARRLGAVLADLHGRPPTATGGVWWWDTPARSLDDYRARRAADAEAALAGTPAAGLAASAAARAAPGGDAPGGLRMLHGDLVTANVVWGPRRPGLVDWEFWRRGDPAEDLAYLIAVNGLAQPAADAVLRGHGDARAAARVGAWRVIVLADAAGWYLAEGRDDLAADLLERARREP